MIVFWFIHQLLSPTHCLFGICCLGGLDYYDGSYDSESVGIRKPLSNQFYNPSASFPLQHSYLSAPVSNPFMTQVIF